MINITRKEDCTGCSACVDLCDRNAITLATDIEGFWYPKVASESCTECGLCEQVCPELHVETLKNDRPKMPTVLAAYHKDNSIRHESTSGGLFSALAEKMYDEGGYVGGSVYTEDFFAKHVVSNRREDLLRIRGSKHFQSDMVEVFTQVKQLLEDGEKVLICGAPCQMAGLRLFLGKEYENLVVVDFICLGINSPKIFHKYLESLERSHGAKTVDIHAKNKDLGWRSLSYKIKFGNDRVYLREGRKDDFVRGYVHTHCMSRPACYECRYKGFPRISDITLGDFWGIEKVDKSMDDNMGTSVVLLNTEKGIRFFEKLENDVVKKEVQLADVMAGNLALVRSIELPTVDRAAFFRDADQLSFDKVVEKYYPLKNGSAGKFKKRLSAFKNKIAQMGWQPKSHLQFLWLNFFRKNTRRADRKRHFFFPTRHVVLDIHRHANLVLKGSMLYGYKRIRGSKMESRLAVEGDGTLAIESGHVTAYYGTDILVFKGAKLTFQGKAIINQKVQIICMDSITIGNHVLISRDVVIRDNDGGHEIVASGYKKTAPVTIGNHVWIGQGAIIMKGVTIGDGAIIGAGAFVATNVKPNTLVMGDPARAIKKDVIWRG